MAIVKTSQQLAYNDSKYWLIKANYAKGCKERNDHKHYKI
jgi:hypothetical protein